VLERILVAGTPKVECIEQRALTPFARGPILRP
jgi:hypothetical protein